MFRVALYFMCVAAVLVPRHAVAQFSEEIIRAPSDGGALGGIVVTPNKESLANILIIPGSGNVDHNGDSNTIKASTYRLIAEGLAQRYIRTVRIDKRGLYLSRRAQKNPNRVNVDDYAADVRTWVSSLTSRLNIPCIWLLGHSEGGLVALLAATRHSDQVCGLILVSTPGRPVGELLKAQLRSSGVDQALVDEADTIVSRLRSGQSVTTSQVSPVLQGLFAPDIQELEISEFRLDPSALARSYAGTMLIIQGANDIQVAPRDGALLYRSHPGSELVIMKDTNHILKTVVSLDRASNIRTYTNPGLPLAPGVIDTIASYVLRSR